MVVLVFVMLLCVGLALAVVLAVAVPARREGRDLLTPHGEDVVARLRRRSESLAAATRERAASAGSRLRAAWARRREQPADDATPARPESAPPQGTASAA